MRIRLNLKPGQKGTKKLCNKYGDTLVCVRYRYDEIKKKRYKTVELIIEETDWEPPVENKIDHKTIVKIKTAPKEIRLRNQIKDAGGKWNNKNKVWEIEYGKAVQMGMENRLIEI
ncbi:hypothetical protein MHK_000247 [Candidatus Magnetomorum sp. HK-1]|jgi:hypothetical protein|nr:hypothetical protein MHK_000247 [Candidatus Magnetomorum sp. HK-1]